jgi:hypothetical protein
MGQRQEGSKGRQTGENDEDEAIDIPPFLKKYN